MTSCRPASVLILIYAYLAYLAYDKILIFFNIYYMTLFWFIIGASVAVADNSGTELANLTRKPELKQLLGYPI